MRVLICENEPSIRLLLRMAAPPSFEFVESDSGDTCLQQLTASRPDLLLVDLMLPGLGGIEVLHAKRADPELDGIPAIVMTGRHEPEIREAALAAGADRFITKPFSPFELLSMMEAIGLRRTPPAALSADERRAVANELLYRRANEATERARLATPPLVGAEDALLTFMCECGEPCETEIRLTLAEYDHVRSDPTWFALSPGHENLELELTVESSTRFTLVQKVKAEGISVATEDDPR